MLDMWMYIRMTNEGDELEKAGNLAEFSVMRCVFAHRIGDGIETTWNGRNFPLEIVEHIVQVVVVRFAESHESIIDYVDNIIAIEANLERFVVLDVLHYDFHAAHEREELSVVYRIRTIFVKRFHAVRDCLLLENV